MKKERPDKTQARDNLTRATAGMTSDTVALLSLKEVSAMVKVVGLTVTFLRNMQQSTVTLIERQKLREVADGIVAQMKPLFPNVAATPKRDRTIKVWLDGLPEEIE